MINARAVRREHQNRFIRSGALLLAGILMIAFATIQLQVNGVRGLAQGKFLGVLLLVGFFTYRTGRWLALGLFALTRAIGQRRGPKT